MKHNIKFVKKDDETSYWITPNIGNGYISSCLSSEISDKEDFVNAILKEFCYSDDTIIPLMKEKLDKWIEAMDDKDLEIYDGEKLKDFIYEMF